MEFRPAESALLPESRVHSLVEALDGRQVDGELINWIASVNGVHGDGRSWWIQVSRADDATASVVLRCSRFATAAHAVAALRRWPPVATRSLLVLQGMCRV